MPGLEARRVDAPPWPLEDAGVRTLVGALGYVSLVACGPSTPPLTSDQLLGKQSMVVLLEGPGGFAAEARDLSAGGDGVRLDTTSLDRITLLLYDEPLEALPLLRAGPLSLASEGDMLPPQDVVFELVLDADDRRWRQVDTLRDAVAALRLARGGPGPKAPSVCDKADIEYVTLTATTATTTGVVFVERAEGRDVLIGTNDHQLWRVSVGDTPGQTRTTTLTLPRDRPGAGAGWLAHDKRTLWVSNGTDLVTYDLGGATLAPTIRTRLQRLPGFVNHLSGPPRSDDPILLATTSNAEVLRIDMNEGSVRSLGTATTSMVPMYYQDMRLLRTSSVTVLTQGVSDYWDVTPRGIVQRQLRGVDLGCDDGRVGRGTVWRNDIMVALVECGTAKRTALAQLSGPLSWQALIRSDDDRKSLKSNEEPRSLVVLGGTVFLGHADSIYSRYDGGQWCAAHDYGVRTSTPTSTARLQLNFAVAIDAKTVLVAGPRVNGDEVGPLAVGVLRFPL